MRVAALAAEYALSAAQVEAALAFAAAHRAEIDLHIKREEQLAREAHG